jgi:hypothetical protein
MTTFRRKAIEQEVKGQLSSLISSFGAGPLLST